MTPLTFSLLSLNRTNYVCANKSVAANKNEEQTAAIFAFDKPLMNSLRGILTRFSSLQKYFATEKTNEISSLSSDSVEQFASGAAQSSDSELP